jgi:hypothetical protein
MRARPSGTSVAPSHGIPTRARTLERSTTRSLGWPPRAPNPGHIGVEAKREFLSLLTTLLIYLQLIPLAVLDLSVTFYQWICFPVYGISHVPRRRYFVLDRHRLSYLGRLEKLNCTYCAYANGVMSYTREVSARTEAYWCSIKHRARPRDPLRLYRSFSTFGDAPGYRHGLTAQRSRLRSRRSKASTI